MDEQSKKQLLKETFDSVAEGYDSEALRFFPNSARLLAQHLGLRGDEHVLDVATGTGHTALAIARLLPQGRVTGVDFADGMLKQARRKAAAANVANVEFLKKDMHSLEFSGRQFDAAVCSFGVFFADDMDAQLSRIAAAVKTGGSIAISGFQEHLFSPLSDLFFQRLSVYGVQTPAQDWKRIANREGCIVYFENAGLGHIRVEQKNMGYFLDDGDQWWDVIWNAGLRRLVSGMKPELRDKFRREHLQEVDELRTSEGIWLNVGVLFTFGTKQ
ncbi:MAG: methyltransferase domain-containing protein [Thermoleophilia bacterium]